MKKALVVMIALTVGGLAFASSLSVPWFVDTAPAQAKFPPNVNGVSGIVYLHNNTLTPKVCSIEYFTQAGSSVGPASPDNTFVIAPQASIAFRPVASDPSTAPGGQESIDSGWLVPDRPMITVAGEPDEPKKNGSLGVTWLGEATDVQGVYVMNQFVVQPDSAVGKLVSYAFLLPPGA